LTKLQFQLLLGALFLIGALFIYNKLDHQEPESAKSSGLCPSCGQMLPGRDGVCQHCEAKKNREKIEAAARGGAPSPPKEESGKSGKLMVGLSAAALLLCVAFWPQIQRVFGLRNKDDPEYLTFYCLRCRRKLRYRASLAGTQGMCPTCKEVCTFPIPDPDSAY
jgi:hypothetical protein